MARGGRADRGDGVARGRHDRGRGRRRRRVPRALDGVAAEVARARRRRRRARGRTCGPRPERAERRLRVDALGRPADPPRPGGRPARARGRARIRARCPGGRRVVRARGRRRLVPGGADPLRRHERVAARIARRGDRGLRRARRARGGPPDHGRGASPAVRRRVPRRCDPPYLGDRPSRAAGARPPRPCHLRGSSTARAHGRAPSLLRRDRDDRDRSGARPGSRARRQQRHRRLPRLPARARGRLEPHGHHRAGAGRDRGARMDGRRGDRRPPHAPPLHEDDPGRPNRVRLGRRDDGLRRTTALPPRGRPACSGGRRKRPPALLPAAARPADHPCLGRADRRLPHAPADLREPRPCASRVRLHGERRRAVLPRGRDPGAAGARSPGRADAAGARRPRPQVDAAGAVSLGGRLGDSCGARSSGRGGRRGSAARPRDPFRHGLPRRLGLRLPR